ncbi:MAB_1171c family putative transporter [Streptomyces sp. NPDC004647]|uniref:MAB_1171c family putative transporter n=1 Tax=Streptomyces sp. NPDC004647 TaxID=3154671 RepID=UPI0033BA69E6
MAGDLAELGNRLEYPCSLFLWFAVLVRGPSAFRSPQQRGLWLAVATAAVAMALNLPVVVSLILKASGSAHGAALTRNMFGLLSAGAVLHFVAVAHTSGRRLKVGLCLAVGAIMVALLLFDLGAPPHQEHSIPAVGEPSPSAAYWLTLIAAHLLANAACVRVCWRYGLRAESPSLGAGLKLFGLGTAFAGLFWLVYFLRLTLDTNRVMPFLPLLMNLHAVFRASAILVPTLFTARRAAADITTAWHLWPLWRDLVDAVPHVALTKPRSRTAEILWPLIPRKLLVYRRVIETRDAILVLYDYVQPAGSGLACSHGTDAGVPHPGTDAAVLACAMREARSAKLAGHRPQRSSAVNPFAFDGDLEDERTFLLDVARAYGAARAGALSSRPSPGSGSLPTRWWTRR